MWLAAVVAEIGVASSSRCCASRSTSNTEGIGDLDLDRTYVITLLVTAVVAAPIVEEMIFRGLMLRGLLSRMRPGSASACRVSCSALAHVDPARGVGNIGLALVLSAVGIVLGGAAYLLRRIGPTMLAHAIFNAVVMAIVLTVDSTKRSHGRTTRWSWLPPAPTRARRTPGRGSSPATAPSPVSVSDGAHTARPSDRRAVAVSGRHDAHVGTGDGATRTRREPQAASPSRRAGIAAAAGGRTPSTGSVASPRRREPVVVLGSAEQVRVDADEPPAGEIDAEAVAAPRVAERRQAARHARPSSP